MTTGGANAVAQSCAAATHEQLSLLTERRPPNGDRGGLESTGSILRRWLDELSARQQAAA